MLLLLSLEFLTSRNNQFRGQKSHKKKPKCWVALIYHLGQLSENEDKQTKATPIFDPFPPAN